MSQSEFETNACYRSQARENACEPITIGLALASHWLRKRREFYQPITGRGNAKPKQTRNDSQLKTAQASPLVQHAARHVLSSSEAGSKVSIQEKKKS